MLRKEDFHVEERTIGELECVLVDAFSNGQAPKALAIICHGFGASGRDLVGLAPEWISESPQIRESIRFVFPAAPIILGQSWMGESRAWWPIDMVALEQSMASGTPRIRREEEPEELPTRNAEINTLITTLSSEVGFGVERMILGGFSQGSMLTTDVVLSLGKNPLGQIIFSGTLLCEERWKSNARKRSGLSIYQSHGRQDPLLRFEEAEALRDLLTAAGLEIEFHAFDGEHTIGPSAMAGSRAYLESRLASLDD